MVEFVDLVALRPIRRKNGTKAVLMADGTLLELVMPLIECTSGGKFAVEFHLAYLWRMAFVSALLKAGYHVPAAKNHVLEVTRTPGERPCLSKIRLWAEAVDARKLLPFKDPTPPKPRTETLSAKAWRRRLVRHLKFQRWQLAVAAAEKLLTLTPRNARTWSA